jgi:hypothetical protein
MGQDSKEKRCPRCGRGVLVDVTFREGSEGQAEEAIQTSDSRQVESYSCGHEVVGPALDRTESDSERLEVERRESDETVDPL